MNMVTKEHSCSLRTFLKIHLLKDNNMVRDKVLIWGGSLPSKAMGQYTDSSFAPQHQSLLWQEQLLKAQTLQSSSVDEVSRQADYLAARGATIRHPAQDLASYSGRMNLDSHSLSLLNDSSYSGRHAPSILGAAPQENVDDPICSEFFKSWI